MPIYNKPPPQATSNKSAAKIDDHASEAAKVKRTREQAYFNSYNFDAIEVLPYDDEDDDDDGVHRAKPSATATKYAHSSRVHSPTRSHHHLSAQASLSSKSNHSNTTASTSSGGDCSSRSSSRSTGGTYQHSQRNDLKYATYLQRLGAFFTNSQRHDNGNDQAKHFPINAASTNRLTVTYHQAYTQQQQPSQPSQHSTSSNEHNGAAMSIRNNGDKDNANHMADNGNFLLPRAMLKYQSVGIANSMPLAVISSSSSSSSSPLALMATTSTAAATAATTTQAAAGKLLQNANNNNATNNNSKKPLPLLTTATASKILYPHGSANNFSGNSNIQKTRLNHVNGNNESHTGFLIATAATENLSATNGTTTALRVKKQSTSSTATTISDSAVSVERSSNLHTVCHGDAAINKNNRILPKNKPNPTDGEQRGRSNSHQSHYSTDKSASSGYYSSNVCSTYSLEDHIYCEPVTTSLDQSKSKSGILAVSSLTAAAAATATTTTTADSQIIANVHDRRQQMPKQIANTIVTAAAATTPDADSKVEQSKLQANSLARVMNGVGQSKRYGADAADATEADEDEPDGGGERVASLQLESETFDTQHFNENLRILETSIENLDRHLKNFPSLSSQERIASFMYSHQTFHPSHYDVGDKTRVYHHLPTIMEGYDPTNQPRPWQDEITDDSLLDIDLDSFLLSSERKDSSVKHSKSAKRAVGVASAAGGIDNPSFLADEQEENNYKCAKYINSCPEDAYRVESDILTGTGGTVSQKSLSMEHFLKHYEDRLHFESTRELLEDVRDKIRLLSQCSTERQSTSSDDGEVQKDSIVPHNTEMPKELEGMIATLKRELEAYLQRMNQHSELEIRQLCSGLVKNHNIVKMKNAFERRRSATSANVIETECDCLTYEAVRDGVLMSASGVPITIQEHITSIRCASDPNFKMKRKSLTEIFPLTDCYIEPNNAKERIDQATHAMHKTQLQRNLTFHKPVLNKLDSQAGQNAAGSVADIRGNDASASSGDSAAEAGDKNGAVDWHRKRPSIWEMYYGTNRMSQSLLGKRNSMVVHSNQATMSYPSSRPESDFTLDLPRAEQLRIKMEKEKKFRQRCRYITTFLSLIFFLLTVMVVSLVLTRGKRMFGSMI